MNSIYRIFYEPKTNDFLCKYVLLWANWNNKEYNQNWSPKTKSSFSVIYAKIVDTVQD